MSSKPVETTLELRPEARFDVIDVSSRLTETYGEIVAEYPRTLYVSYHTTAGYLDPRIARRLDHDPEAIRSFMDAFRRAFPKEAGYHHDQLERRTELSEEQKATEPLNADSHLQFISSGLTSCVAYEQAPGQPVWWVELDGTNGDRRRIRRTTVIGYNEERPVDRMELQVPVSAHGFDSVNLKDPDLGLFQEIQAMIDRAGIDKGRIDIALKPGERYSGLVVNEYETLLMRHDLREVLGDPLHYVAEKGKALLKNPRSIPSKTMSYARYDVVHVVNEVMDVLGLSESVVERIVNRLMGLPASRFLRMKRKISLPVVDRDDGGRGEIVHGTYQSPILVQWKRPKDRVRTLDVTLLELG